MPYARAFNRGLSDHPRSDPRGDLAAAGHDGHGTGDRECALRPWLLVAVQQGEYRRFTLPGSGARACCSRADAGAGGGLFTQQEWWRIATAVASGISLALFAVYFTPWLTLAVLLDIALLWAVLWLHWPSAAQLGA